MTCRNRLSIFAALAVSAAAAISHAAPLEPKHLPADTKWVIHVDVDAGRDSKTFETVSDAIFSNPQARDGIDKLEQLTNAKFPNDLNDVTVYGASTDDQAGVIVIHAKVDRGQMETAVKKNPGYSSVAYGNYNLLTWVDKGETSYGAFHDDGTIVISKKDSNVKSALDAMDGKGELIKADSVLVSGIKPKQLLYIGIDDVATLTKDNPNPNPVVESVKHGWITLADDDKNPVLTAQMTTETPESAENLKQKLDGLNAILGMMSGGQNADPVAKAAAAATASYESKQDKNVVDVKIPMTSEKFADLIAAVQKKRAGR